MKEKEKENRPIFELNRSESHFGPGAKVFPPAPLPRHLYRSTRQTGTQTLWTVPKWNSSAGRLRGSEIGKGWSGQRRRGKEKAKRQGSYWWRWIRRRASTYVLNISHHCILILVLVFREKKKQRTDVRQTVPSITCPPIRSARYTPSSTTQTHLPFPAGPPLTLTLRISCFFAFSISAQIIDVRKGRKHPCCGEVERAAKEGYVD